MRGGVRNGPPSHACELFLDKGIVGQGERQLRTLGMNEVASFNPELRTCTQGLRNERITSTYFSIFLLIFRGMFDLYADHGENCTRANHLADLLSYMSPTENSSLSLGLG